MTANLNGAPVIARTRTVIFIRLPEEAQRPIDGCACEYCKRTGEPPHWDTLAVPIDGRHAWTVHMPDPVAAQQAFNDLPDAKPRRKR
jgi:hypothetical protein